MKTKEEIIAVIDNTNHLSCEDCVAIKHHLTQPTLNPMKIDEERLVRAWKTTPSIKEAIKYYNSTCKDHQVLQPLPKDKPDWFEWSLDTSKYDLWDELVKTYGTPTKKELVSVLELHNDIRNKYGLNPTISQVVKHFHDTYSLNPPKREWWMDLKEGDKFIGSDGRVCTFNGNHIVESSNNGNYYLNRCTPYIEPSIHDKFMASLSDEQKKMYEEMKEVKNGSK